MRVSHLFVLGYLAIASFGYIVVDDKVGLHQVSQTLTALNASIESNDQVQVTLKNVVAATGRVVDTQVRFIANIGILGPTSEEPGAKEILDGLLKLERIYEEVIDRFLTIVKDLPLKFKAPVAADITMLTDSTHKMHSAFIASVPFPTITDKARSLQQRIDKDFFDLLEAYK